MMQSIVGIVLVWMVMIPAIATADPPTTAEIKEIVNGLGQKVDALGKQLEQAGKEVIPKLTNIESNTKSLELQKKVEDLGKLLTNIEANTKATFSTTFWILVGSVLVAAMALIAAFSASTSNRLDRAAIHIERVIQTVTALRGCPETNV